MRGEQLAIRMTASTSYVLSASWSVTPTRTMVAYGWKPLPAGDAAPFELEADPRIFNDLLGFDLPHWNDSAVRFTPDVV
jgi:hypothetical protein